MIILFCIVQIAIGSLEIKQPKEFSGQHQYTILNGEVRQNITKFIDTQQLDLECLQFETELQDDHNIIFTSCENIDHLSKYDNIELIIMLNKKFKVDSFQDNTPVISLTNFTLAEYILQYLIQEKQKNETTERSSIFATFIPDKGQMKALRTSPLKQPKIQVQLGLVMYNMKSYEMLRPLQQYHQELLAKGVEFEFYYQMIPCYTCQSRHNYSQIERNCYGGGRYCQFCEDNNNLSGQQILDEIIRQSCLHHKNLTAYFYYMEQFGRLCNSDTRELNKCSQDAFIQANISMMIINDCVGNSFINDDKENKLQTNLILEKHKAFKFNSTHPKLFIDNKLQKYKKFDDVFEDICYKLENNPPEFCYKLIRISKYTNVNRLEIIFFLLFIALIVLLVILMLIQITRKFKLTKNYSQLNSENKVKIPEVEIDNL